MLTNTSRKVIAFVILPTIIFIIAINIFVTHFQKPPVNGRFSPWIKIGSGAGISPQS